MYSYFDPLQLTPEASLNRTVFVQLPQFAIPEQFLGECGFDLISTKAISETIRKQGRELRLTNGQLALSDRELPICFDSLLQSPEPQVLRCAQKIAQEFTSRVAYLVLTLTQNHQTMPADLDDWSKQYRQYWGGIETILFGGGLLSGNLGKYLAETIPDFWQANGFPPLRFRLARDSAILSLQGAAYSAAEESRNILAFDFGGSLVKRGQFRFQRTIQTEIHLLRTLPVPTGDADFNSSDPEVAARFVSRFIIETICDTWREIDASKEEMASVIPVSLASYVRHGQPLARQGGAYSTLCRLGDDAQQIIGQDVRHRIGAAVRIRLLHDGTAAASNYRGLARTAVITIGTALGIGFPPH